MDVAAPWIIHRGKLSVVLLSMIQRFCSIWFSLVWFLVFLQCVDTVGWVI